MLILVVFLVATIKAFRGPNGIKKFSVRQSAYVNFVSSNDDIESSLRELLRCEQSFNPIDRWRVPGLREKIRQLEMLEEKEIRQLEMLEEKEIRQLELKEKAIRQLEMLGKKEIRQLEMWKDKDLKEITLLTANENFPEVRVQISRKMLNDWLMSGRLLVSTDNPYKTYTANNFADIIELNIYDLITIDVPLANLDRYLRTKVDIQTSDCIDAILNGQLYFPPFSNSSDTIAIPKFEIYLPRNLNQSEYGMTFPIVPDAVLM